MATSRLALCSPAEFDAGRGHYALVVDLPRDTTDLILAVGGDVRDTDDAVRAIAGIADDYRIRLTGGFND